MWDKKTGEIIQNFDGHTTAIPSLLLSGSSLISGAHRIRIWDVWEGSAKKVLHAPSEVTAMAVVNSYVFVGFLDANIRIWDLDGDDVPITSWDLHLHPISCLEIADDGYLYSGSDFDQSRGQPNDYLVRKWNTTTLTDQPELEYKIQGIGVTALRVKGDKMFVALKNFTIEVWNTKKGDKREQVFTGCTTCVVSMVILDHNLFCGHEDGTIWIRNIEVCFFFFLKKR